MTKKLILLLMLSLYLKAHAVTHTKFTFKDQEKAKEIIKEIALETNTNESLLLAICQNESSLDKGAVGDDKSSHGLCQVKRTTMEEAEYFGHIKQLYDPVINVIIASDHLRKCYNYFHHINLAIACYNRGIRGLNRYIRKNSSWAVDNLSYVIKVRSLIE